MVSAQPRPPAKRTGQEVLLVNRGQHLGYAALESPVGDTRNAQWTLLLFAGLGDIDPPDRRRSISLAVHGSEHGLDPHIEVRLRLPYRLAIHTWG